MKIAHNIGQRAAVCLLLYYLVIGSLLFIFTGCCTYSFTGSSVPEHLKTVAIPVAEDRSGAAIPGMREKLTEDLIRKFIDDNSLQVTERSKADAILECTIISVKDIPSIVSAGENISQRRLTVTVQVKYKDLVKRISVFDKKFSNYGDYVPGKTENDRVSAADVALDKIAEDVLLAVVSGW
ncbi:hypothetical protein BMS3Abin03_00742 [bacterium BMS3Abin03]|nr:hypothetical protein BMS3Abin03_00742 [bacterium BMS3Abin03]